jgi:hypothetical protein
MSEGFGQISHPVLVVGKYFGFGKSHIYRNITIIFLGKTTVSLKNFSEPLHETLQNPLRHRRRPQESVLPCPV